MVEELIPPHVDISEASLGIYDYVYQIRVCVVFEWEFVFRKKLVILT